MTPDIEKFNKDELSAPSWLDETLITKVLQKNLSSNSVVIKNLRITPGTAKNDHYASVMFRVNVDYQQGDKLESKSMIIKTMPEEDGQKKDLLKDSFIFETEIGMYTEVLPRFEKILRSIGDQTTLKASCLYHSLSPKKFIIFEDIVPLGYAVIRDRTLTLEEVKATYLKLAKWHAISYKINKEEPNYFDEYRHTFFGMPDIKENEFMTDGIINFIEMLDNTPHLKKYKPYFEAMKDDLLDKSIASFQEYRENPQENTYYVLLHGDFHVKNLMMKHNPKTKAFEDVLLLDFQISCIAPMALDIMYSFYMLLSAEMRANHWEELQYYYFSNFVKTLKDIGFNGEMPKMIEFRKLMMQHKHFELYLFVSFLPIWFGMEANADVDELISSNDQRKQMYYYESYQKEVEKLLERYLHMGYLES